MLFIEGDLQEVRSLALRAVELWQDRDKTELGIPNQTFFTTTTVISTASTQPRLLATPA
ncbi:hypothetical protein [Synechococcus sp. CCY 9618]|uniref:hypothetical protein n=1 Tax=Synechococcus sp. CCY 9618 TaxID=2815602 RepID=UPI001C223AB1|nr:hypothetical protein [Synechococcus sp. CCY 9618]